MYVNMYVPVATSTVNALLSAVMGKLPEFIDFKFPSRSEGREGKRLIYNADGLMMK